MINLKFIGVVGLLATPIFFGVFNENTTPSKIIFESKNLQKLTLDNKANESLTDISTEDINISVKFKYDNFDIKEQMNVSGNFEDYRDEFYERSKKYFSTKNNELMKKIDTINMKNIYVSKYTPFFNFTLKTKDLSMSSVSPIETLAKKDYIDEINIKYPANRTTKEKLYGVKDTLGINHITDDLGYTGKGVKVGVLDVGVIDEDNEVFEGKNITIKSELLGIKNVQEHPTHMGSIIGGNEGIAPDCSLYSLQAILGFEEEFDWLLDNRVDIVNASIGSGTVNGKYNSDSAYFDYIIRQYKLIVFAAAGNDGGDDGEGTGYIANPGLGYNVFTIGDCNSMFNPTGESSWVTVEGPTKPNMTAIGIDVDIPGFSGSYTGTSISTAVVSGCTALLLEKYPELKGNPAAVYALLGANTSIMAGDYGRHNEPRIYEGTGCINIDRAFANKYLLRYGHSTNSDYYIMTPCTPGSGDVLKVYGFWLAYSDGTVKSLKFHDYDIILVDINNATKMRTRGVKNNFEYIEYPVYTESHYQAKFSLVDYNEDLDSVDDDCGFAIGLIEP